MFYTYSFFNQQRKFFVKGALAFILPFTKITKKQNWNRGFLNRCAGKNPLNYKRGVDFFVSNGIELRRKDFEMLTVILFSAILKYPSAQWLCYVIGSFALAMSYTDVLVLENGCIFMEKDGENGV